jgi:hypothetical protein
LHFSCRCGYDWVGDGTPPFVLRRNLRRHRIYSLLHSCDPVHGFLLLHLRRRRHICARTGILLFLLVVAILLVISLSLSLSAFAIRCQLALISLPSEYIQCQKSWQRVERQMEPEGQEGSAYGVWAMGVQTGLVVAMGDERMRLGVSFFWGDRDS